MAIPLSDLVQDPSRVVELKTESGTASGFVVLPLTRRAMPTKFLVKGSEQHRPKWVEYMKCGEVGKDPNAVVFIIPADEWAKLDFTQKLNAVGQLKLIQEQHDREQLHRTTASDGGNYLTYRMSEPWRPK